MSTAPASVRRRHVFFVAGFDRKRPRYYHALYRSQARRQSAVSGMALTVSREHRRPGPFSTAWTSECRSAGTTVHATHEVLEWHDIVQAHWARSAWRVVSAGAAAVWSGWRDGTVRRLFALARPPVVATLLPLLALVLAMVAALAGGAGVAWVARTGLGATALVAAASAVSTAALLAWLGVVAVHRWRLTWLLRLMHFTDLQAQRRVAGLDERLAAFADRVAAVVDGDGGAPPDEVLIVGHSVGANLAIGMLAGLLDRLGDPAAPGRPPIALLSLGHCLPLIAMRPAAHHFRADLQRVAGSSFDWLDITAPIDWAAFPLVDPVAAAGLPAPPSGWHPCLQSPRFHRLFSADAYARLKRNRFQVHMQYLKASERPGLYDYFAITAGPQRLRDRFAGATADPAPAAAPRE